MVCMRRYASGKVCVKVCVGICAAGAGWVCEGVFVECGWICVEGVCGYVWVHLSA